MDHELIEIILHGSEERNIEYKSSLSWKDANARAKLIKSILAMANIRDGGFIVVGVEEKGGHFEPAGVSDKDFHSYSQDKVSSDVATYADPFVELTVNRIQHEQKRFVIMQVEEFTELPVICKKDGPGGLRAGAIYTRTRRMFETAQVPSQTEMREIVENAVGKAVTRFRVLVSRAGVEAPMNEKERSRQQFDRELKGL